MNLLSLCWKPFGHEKGNHGANGVLGGGGSSGGSKEGKDGLLWYRDIGKYGSGDFSMAVIQANQVLEDQSQIESGQYGTFVGIYDGHGGPETARYVCDHLFKHFRGSSLWVLSRRSCSYVGVLRLCVYAAIAAESQGVVTAETIQRAFRQTEEGFTTLVSESWSTRPNMATVGTCCLVGVIHQQTLFIANLGDSRVVLGKKVGNTGGIAALQLSTEHNANIAAIRQELKELHPNDPQIVVLKHGVWRVKGIIQENDYYVSTMPQMLTRRLLSRILSVSRSIGDVYMKHARYNREPINGKFRLPEPMNMPILSANPTIISHDLQPNDSFLIFASDGLWEHL
ncbi:hypothetical protein Goari_003233, partial [Gossypium aridum]|nr:hypothetical protein [Gossypium aridum]